MIIIPTYSGKKQIRGLVELEGWDSGTGTGHHVLGNQGVKISKVGKITAWIPALVPVSILFLSDSNPI